MASSTIEELLTICGNEQRLQNRFYSIPTPQPTLTVTYRALSNGQQHEPTDTVGVVCVTIIARYLEEASDGYAYH